MGCSCQFLLCRVFLTGFTEVCSHFKVFFSALYYLFLTQYRRPLIDQPSPWQPKVRCMSPGSREPMAALRSQLSVWSTDVAAARNGEWPQITFHLSSCLWKFAVWSLVSFHIIQYVFHCFKLKRCLVNIVSLIASFYRFHLQVSGCSHEPVWRESPQHSLETVPGATSQPTHGRPSCGRTSHLLHRRHQRHTDHAALDCEYTLDTHYV